MRTSLKPIFLSLLLVILASSSPTQSTTQNDDTLIRQTCQKTTNYNLCLETLESDPRSFQASDVKGLAGVSLQITLAKANDTFTLVLKFFRQAPEHGSYERLGTCVEEYGKATTGTLPAAISALNSNNYGAAKGSLQAASSSAQTCEDQFVGLGGSPVARENKLVQDLALVTSNIISILG